MAVAHSAVSESHTGNTGSTNQAAFSWTHTQTGTPRGVVVFVSTYQTVTDTVTSVTYGGVALTRLTGGLAEDGAGELGRLDTFFLGSGLGTGNQTITVNRTNNATQMYAAAATVTAGADTAVPTQTIVLLEGDGTLAQQSVDDTSPGQNSLRYAGCYSGLNSPPPNGANSTLIANIDIGNYGSALVRETTAGQGARNVGFTGATDDRAAVHLAIRELVPRTETPIVGAFTLTGNDATFTKASPKVMDGGTGAFTLTGNPADLRHNPDLEAGTGTFTLDGQPVDARHNVRIEANTGTFALDGQPVTLTKTTPKILTADRGQFTLTGNDATLQRNYAVTAEVGTFSVTGEPVTLRHNVRIEANTGSFALTGGQPSLLFGRYLSGGAGEFIETGQPATFRRTWAVDANTGTFSLTGNPASLTEINAYEINPVLGTFVATGQDAALQVGRVITGGGSSYFLTGHNATLTEGGGGQGYTIAAAVGGFALTGQSVGLLAARKISGDLAAFALTGQAASLSYSGPLQNYILPVAVGAFIFNGQANGLLHDRKSAAGLAAFTLTGQQTTFAAARLLTAAAASYALTGNANGMAKVQRRRVLIF